MSTLVKNARSNKIWHLLHKATGYSASYCKKVILGERNNESEGAKIIIEKFNEISEIIEPCKN